MLMLLCPGSCVFVLSSPAGCRSGSSLALAENREGWGGLSCHHLTSEGIDGVTWGNQWPFGFGRGDCNP